MATWVLPPYREGNDHSSCLGDGIAPGCPLSSGAAPPYTDTDLLQVSNVPQADGKTHPPDFVHYSPDRGERRWEQTIRGWKHTGSMHWPPTRDASVSAASIQWKGVIPKPQNLGCLFQHPVAWMSPGLHHAALTTSSNECSADICCSTVRPSRMLPKTIPKSSCKEQIY